MPAHPPQISPLTQRIDFLQNFPGSNTILLICAPRNIFHRLLESPLPLPTPRNLRYAENTRVVWAPSYRHARVYLSTVAAVSAAESGGGVGRGKGDGMEAEQAAVQEAEQEAEQETGQEAEQETGKEAEKDKQPGGGFLAIWGLTNAQYCTTEWSAQGVARTISQAIDAANRTGRTLVLAGTKGWLDRKMPLLNTDVDTTGITHLLERKMVTVRGVLKRWFRIPREEEGGRKRKRKRKMGEKDEKEEKEEHDKLNKIKRKAPATSGSGTSGTSAGNKDSQPKRIKF